MTEKDVFATIGPDVLTNRNSENKAPYHQEEADGRLLFHVADAARCGHTNVTIRSVDTDVVVLAISLFTQINIPDLWIAFGTGKDFRYLPIHEIVNSLGPAKTDSLLFFHSFTGCDSVSNFHGIGKKTAWAAWTGSPDISVVFKALSSATQIISDSQFQEIQKFTVKMYDKTCQAVFVNDARKELFAKKGRAIDRIPPTSSALLQHTKRAAYQAGHVWASSLDNHAQLPSPLDWGWETADTGIKPIWTDIPEASKSCQELIRCRCKKGCLIARCKCLRAKLPCTDLCKCGGGCQK